MGFFFKSKDNHSLGKEETGFVIIILIDLFTHILSSQQYNFFIAFVRKTLYWVTMTDCL